MQLAGIELLGNEKDAEWRLAIPGALLARAPLTDRHVTATLLAGAVFARAEIVQRRRFGFCDQHQTDRGRHFEQVGRLPVIGTGNNRTDRKNQQQGAQAQHLLILQLPDGHHHAMFPTIRT